MTPLKKTLFAILVLFAAIGAAFTAVFFGMRLGLFNVRGTARERNSFFLNSANAIGAIDQRAQAVEHRTPCTDGSQTCEWNTTSEWLTVQGGLEKDAEVIRRVSAETGVPARMLAAVVVPEQSRFFSANREVFKRYFEPLKILGAMSQFSLGVSGIKIDTAQDIERHAADPLSPFYPGPGMTELFAYGPETDHDTELFERLTEPKDHYYQYLYTALYVREIEAQWLRAGFDISGRPDIIVTLFNLGFVKSRPHEMPEAGGAPLSIGGRTYSYGELGGLFYASDELRALFP